MTDLTKIPSAKNITEDWGERCSDFESECPCCQMWAMHDAIDSISSENAALKAERDRLERNRDMWKGQVERQAASLENLRIRGQAFANQVRHVTYHLNGQAYSSTVSELNAFDAALSTGQEADNG